MVCPMVYVSNGVINGVINSVINGVTNGVINGVSTMHVSSMCIWSVTEVDQVA